MKYALIFLFLLVGCDGDGGSGNDDTQLGVIEVDRRELTGEEALIYQETLDCMADIYGIECEEPFDPPTVRITEAEIVKCRGVDTAIGCLLANDTGIFFELAIEPNMVGDFNVLVHLYSHLISGICADDYDFDHLSFIWNNQCFANAGQEVD